ncbi:MAG: hypothetical protein ACRBBR_07835 [Cellvibrionaceae bacterium]
MMPNSITMLKIECLIAFICTLLLLAAGMHGVFTESILLRPAQILTVVLLVLSIVFYLKLLSAKEMSAQQVPAQKTPY